MHNTTTVINPCKGFADHISIAYPDALKPNSGLGIGTEKSSVESSEKSTEKSTEKILTVLQATSDLTIKLKREGRLQRIGPDKGGHWQVQVQKAAN